MNLLVEQFLVEVEAAMPLTARFNIAPTQPVASVRQRAEDGARELVTLRWGLVPSWAKDPSVGSRMINARGESVAEKPAFRAAFKRRRCLVLADGYYEWQKVGKRKQPFLIHREDQGPFAFAGLWESWPAGADESLETCTIITTDANELTRHIHDRMPVILDPENHERWLDVKFQDRSQLESLLCPNTAQPLVADPVSTHVNNPRNDDPRCVEVVA